MSILKKDATDIVNELSKLIDMKLNIVDAKGIILANSDPERVGDFHEAGYKMVKESINELVAHTDDEFKGTRAGCNLLLRAGGKTVGIVGITGPYEVAKSYGKIIQKMTEILLQSRAEENKYMQKMQDKEHFLLTWVCNQDTVINDSFVEYGKAIGVDITRPRRVLVVRPAGSHTASLLQLARDAIASMEGNQYAFLTARSAVIVVDDQSDETVKIFAKKIHTYLLAQGLDTYIGVDIGAAHFANISHQYMQAKKAVELGVRLQNQSVLCYRDHMLAFFLDDVPIEAKRNYIQNIFGDYDSEDLKRDMRYISVLYEENGSIKHAAERLIIHPNTLQYQLKKIKTRTGYDPRHFNCVALFQIVPLFLAEGLADVMGDDGETTGELEELFA